MNAPERAVAAWSVPSRVRMEIRTRVYAGEPLPALVERYGYHPVLAALGATNYGQGTAAFQRSFKGAAGKLRARRRLNLWLQVAIAILGVIGTQMIALPVDDPLQRYGFWILLGSQPFWLVASVYAKQWGVLLLVLFYTGAWIQAVTNHFF